MLVTGSIALAMGLAMLVPAAAAAQSAAANEYELGPLPTSENDPPATTSSAGDDDGGGESSTSSPAPAPTSVPAIPQSEPATGSQPSASAEPSANDGKDEGRDGRDSGDGRDDQEPRVSAAEVVPAVQANAAQGGGVPVALIILGLVAAAGTGFAAWRMRRRTGEPGEEHAS